MASTRKKTVLTIKEKYLALKDLEKGLTKKNVTEKFSAPQNTLTSWIKHKEDIISKYESGQFGAKRQKLSVGKYDSVDKNVYKWLMNARERNVPIGGHTIRKGALDFAKELNITDFKASERSRYELRDIYTADAFCLFYQQLPTKSFHLKGERCAGRKFSKVCLTGLAVGNGVGEKLPVLVIGKTEKPRCFKGVKSLPCQYKSQRNPGWTLKFFLIMQEGLTQSSMLRVGTLL